MQVRMVVCIRHCIPTRDLGGEEDRRAALLSDGQEHLPHPANKGRGVLAQLPLPARRQAGRVTCEVKLEAVEGIHLGELTQDGDLVRSELRRGEVPQALPATTKTTGVSVESGQTEGEARGARTTTSSAAASPGGPA